MGARFGEEVRLPVFSGGRSGTVGVSVALR